ncbi:MAG: DNA cytosine methyltransferase [Sphingomonadales bacterium]|nr:DNA cytosine methyltransferase [Sphingomonadaceae bacterium]MBS3930381.1 DNA cytosine methyltransferase [Sphingomonadales bacterium]
MTFGSVCSGIEAASVAWHPLGWRAAWLAEIDKFPAAVLKHRYPDVPNLGDMTKIHESEVFNGADIDVLVGGTPCQSFSVAGLRAGLADPRGNLALVFLRLLDHKRPRWVVWENVPGVLSSWSDAAERPATAGDYDAAGQPDPGDGRRGSVVEQSSDFDTFTCGLRELGYGLAWRVLDAQYFGVPQRRRRVFVIGYLGDWRPAAAVLFERHSLYGNPPPSRNKGENVAGPLGACSETGGRRTTDLDGHRAHVVYENHGQDSRVKECDVSPQINAKAGTGGGNLPLTITPAPVMFKPSHYTRGKDGAPSEVSPPLSADADKGDQDPLVFETRFARNGRGAPDTVCPPLKAQSGETGKGDAAPVVAFTQNSRSEVREIGGDGQIVGALAAEPGAQQQNYIAAGGGIPAPGQATARTAVRRLTPRECERLQGFPDDYTNIARNGKDTTDGPRYKALGNSMAVPVMRWIGERIQMVEDLNKK